jgi:PhzF family phenazine biosynthesis protein
MKLKLWQVDAFAEKVFEGNPAAVIPLETWLDTGLMQKIANENNLAETAFFVKTATGRYELRWFTPEVEVPLCGHATLASAWTIFNVLDTALQSIAFETKSGTLTVTRGSDGRNTMSLPSEIMAPLDEAGLAAQIGDALGTTPPKEIFVGKNLLGVWDDAKTIRALGGPGEIARILRPRDVGGFIATAPGDEGYDFVSRYFAPTVGIPEDPVTGGAHCALTPLWATRLGKKTLKARQVSPRGGDVHCTNDGDRALLSGSCAHYMTGEVEVA